MKVREVTEKEMVVVVLFPVIKMVSLAMPLQCQLMLLILLLLLVLGKPVMVVLVLMVLGMPVVVACKAGVFGCRNTHLFERSLEGRHFGGAASRELGLVEEGSWKREKKCLPAKPVKSLNTS